MTPNDAVPTPEPKRQAEPHEDDLLVQRIEIEFAIPVYLPQGYMRELDGLLSSLVRMKMNQLEGHAHWVSGCGSKPMWSQADAVFLGKTPADDAPTSGEPRWDDSVYHVETTCIERPERLVETIARMDSDLENGESQLRTAVARLSEQARQRGAKRQGDGAWAAQAESALIADEIDALLSSWRKQTR